MADSGFVVRAWSCRYRVHAGSATSPPVRIRVAPRVAIERRPTGSPSTPCRLGREVASRSNRTIGVLAWVTVARGRSTSFAHDGCLRPHAPCTRSCRRARSRRLGRRYEPAARPVLIGGDALQPPVVAELSRRGGLARAGLAAGALALGARLDPAEAAPNLRDWGSVRSQFALDPGRIHLTSFLLATHPRAVRDAIAAHRQRLDANPVEYLHGPGDQLSAARARPPEDSSAQRHPRWPSPTRRRWDLVCSIPVSRSARTTRSSRRSTTSTPRTSLSGSPACGCGASGSTTTPARPPRTRS